MNLKHYEKAANLAIRKLRETKLRNGHPFMINTSELPSNEFYLEHPDGSINLTTICWKTYEYKIIKALNDKEIDALRKKLKFPKVEI